jgi:hypothetical protein
MKSMNTTLFFTALILLQMIPKIVLAQDIDTGYSQKWYLKNELESFRLGSSYFDWESFTVKNKYDIGIPTQFLNLKKVVKIGVLDSVDMQHPLMSKYFLPDPSTKENNVVIKELLHGTHTTGVMTSIFDQLKIQNGQPETFFKLLPLQIHDSKPDFDLQAELKRLLKLAIDEKIDVLSTSFVWSKLIHDEEISQLLKTLNDQGAIIISAAGNSHSTVLNYYPCMEQETICVGGANYNGEFALYFDNKFEYGSNYGPEVDLLAPSTGIYSYKSLSTYDFSPALAGTMMKFASGTSQSQPMVAAQIAIIKSLFPDSTARDIRARIFLITKNFPNQPNQYFNGITTSQFYGISISDSIDPAASQIIDKSQQVPVYLMRQSEKLILEDDGTVSVPFKFECLDYRGCQSTKINVRFWQPSAQIQSQRFVTLELDWKSNSTILAKQSYAVNLNDENFIKYEVQIVQNNLFKTVRGTYAIQRQNSAHHAVSIPIDNQIGRKRVSGLRRLNISSPYYRSDIFRYSIYIVNSETGLKVSVLNFANNEVTSKIFPEMTSVISSFIGDSNSDGQPDLQIIANNKNNKTYIYHLNIKLEPLYEDPNGPIELLLAVSGTQKLFPNDTSSIKWRYQNIFGTKKLLPWFVDQYPVLTREKVLGLVPKSIRFAANNLSQLQKQIVAFEPISRTQLQYRLISNLDFHQKIYAAMNLELNGDFAFVGPLNNDPNNFDFLVYGASRDKDFNKVIAIADDFTFSLKDSPFTSVLNPMRNSIRNFSADIKNATHTFYIDQYNSYQLGFYYSSGKQSYEFGIKTKVPVQRVLAAYENQGKLKVILVNNLGLELWTAKPSERSAVLTSTYPISYINSFGFNENIMQFLSKQYLNDGTADVRVYNSFYGGDSYVSVHENSITQTLEATLEKSLTIPKPCILWVNSNLQMAPNESIFDIFYCMGKTQQSILVLQK